MHFLQLDGAVSPLKSGCGQNKPFGSFDGLMEFKLILG
jgi:hypothetical protein